MLLVAACGGGGGGDETPADTTPVVPAKATTSETSPETPTQKPMEKGSVSPETPTPPPSPLVPLQLKATGPRLMFLGTTNTDDRASFEPSPKPVYVDLTKKTSRGGYAEKAVLDEIEHLVGSPHDDSLIGDEKPNVLEGGAGADDLDGRQNRDTASYAGSTHGVDVNLETGFATGGHADGDMLTDIENLIGSDFNDFLTGNAGPNRLDGGAGVNSTDYVRSVGGALMNLECCSSTTYSQVLCSPDQTCLWRRDCERRPKSYRRTFGHYDGCVISTLSILVIPVAYAGMTLIPFGLMTLSNSN